MGICTCPRKRSLVSSFLFVTLLSFSMCLLFLFNLHPTDTDFPSLLREPQKVQHVNRQREILHFEQEQNISEIKQSFPQKLESVPSSSVVFLENDDTQTVAVPVIEDTLCKGPWPNHPDCETKIDWMENNWKKDQCYADNGVDGTRCSFQDYLSLVEHWCPLRPGSVQSETGKSRKASINYDLNPLVEMLQANKKFDWIARRIKTLWPMWEAALLQLEKVKPFQHQQKHILVHIGALSDKANFHLSENADHGGPLGELVQWSDLIATLHLLGHKIVFSVEQSSLHNILPSVPTNPLGGCPSSKEHVYHAIFTDIVGLKQFKRTLKNRVQHYQCLFRVLDSFGTEPQFNFKSWKANKKYRKQAWGNWELNPRQFMTMYPHTPDNSFLGFVVGSNRTNSLPPYKKKETGLVYGKELYMWKDRHDYLDTISKFLNIHATIGTTTQEKDHYDIATLVPGFVTNHGILDHTSLVQLLQETKVFIGLGFPYEGPAPLEAIANGCFYLNPRFEKPLNRDNTEFFKQKPTLRALSSQNPYTEHFIGEPYVYTVNIGNVQEVNRVMTDLMSRETLPPHIPYEYTHEGMLERVTLYLENQDFCSYVQWPPKSTLITKISQEGEGCKATCYREGLVCEPELFSFLNNEEAFSSLSLACSSTNTEHSVHGPSISRSNHCSLQQNSLLLSCVGSEASVRRLCPCRTYKRGQVALCSECVR